MGRLSAVLRSTAPNRVSFWCPGCDGAHAVQIRGKQPLWSYNDNPSAPTFTPSIRVIQLSQRDGEQVREVCHSFVTDGQIKFLGDCTHALAGQTVPLPEWPANEDQTDA
jgi:hypothetical protein